MIGLPSLTVGAFPSACGSHMPQCSQEEVLLPPRSAFAPHVKRLQAGQPLQDTGVLNRRLFFFYEGLLMLRMTS